MPQIIVHIGAPRTGTTVIQKHCLPLLKKTLCISKQPFTGGVPNLTRNDLNTIYDIKQLLNPNSLPSLKASSNNSEVLSLLTSLTQATAIAKAKRNDYHLKLNQKLVGTLSAYINNYQKEKILISLERLCDTEASLICNSRHESENEFNAITLLRAIKDTSTYPLATACLRDPIPYLRSRYIRNIPMRLQKKVIKLSPDKYIQKQSILETNHPGTSALTPAMHAEFIKQLQQHAFVKAFGFQELLASDDVFSLMGLQGEEKYAFKDFPRENKLPFTKEQEQAIEVEIIKALKQYGFYDRIIKAQMFE